MQHPELHQRIHDSFMRQGMMQHLGARLISVKPGMVELSLPFLIGLRNNKAATTVVPWVRWQILLAVTQH